MITTEYKCKSCGRTTKRPYRVRLSLLYLGEPRKEERICPYCMSEDMAGKAGECSLCRASVFTDETRYETVKKDIICENCLKRIN